MQVEGWGLSAKERKKKEYARKSEREAGKPI